MEILTRVKCTDCNATGWQTHAVLVAFEEADLKHYEEKGYRMTDIKRQQWFKSNGYIEPKIDKTKCESCKASGKILVWRDLDEIWRLMKK